MSLSPRSRVHLIACSLLFALSGCALFGKSKPLEIRYFDLDGDTAGAAAAAPSGLSLRLGEVSAARHIDRRFVRRTGTHELGYYDIWRWTDRPDVFLTRTLGHDLFERAGITRLVSGAGPTLEVELTALEEVHAKDRSHARAAVLARLHDDRLQLWQRSFHADAEIGTGEPAAALAEALSKALSQVAAQVVEETLKTLPRTVDPAPEPTSATTPAPGA
jgi:ABC-type uncharacterized transport system auxiliary subunit